jgi:integrase
VVERVRRRLLIDSRRIGPAKEPMAMRDALLVSLMEMTGCRPGEALVLRWRDIGQRIAIACALSGREIVDRTKTGAGRNLPVLRPLRFDLTTLRERSGASADDYVFSTPAGRHWRETDWRPHVDLVLVRLPRSGLLPD